MEKLVEILTWYLHGVVRDNPEMGIEIHGAIETFYDELKSDIKREIFESFDSEALARLQSGMDIQITQRHCTTVVTLVA